MELRELGLTPADAAVFQELAGDLLYPRPELRAPQAELVRNHGSQPLLWAAGISGDWPIVLATIDAADGLPTLRQLFSAHHYWRRRGMTVDLVVLNAQPSSYLQELQDRIMGALFASGETGIGPARRRLRPADGPGGRGHAAHAARHRPPAVRCDGRSLGHVLERGAGARRRRAARSGAAGVAPARAGAARARPRRPAGGASAPTRRTRWPIPRSGLRRSAGARTAPLPRPWRQGRALRFDNGYGGLTADGDYEVRVRGDFVPPAPWVNVVANPHGGFVVSERGAGFSWAGNSYFYRLTPWHNDPVSDPPPEVLYLRDEDTGELWGATPAPVRLDTAYTVRHGAGASVFACEHGGIATRLTLAMAEGEAVKLSLLRVTNTGDRPRRIARDGVRGVDAGGAIASTRSTRCAPGSTRSWGRCSRATRSIRSSPGRWRSARSASR